MRMFIFYFAEKMAIKKRPGKRRRAMDAEEREYKKMKKEEKKTKREISAETAAAQASARILEAEKKKGLTREDVVLAIKEGREREKADLKKVSEMDKLLGLLGAREGSSSDEGEEGEEVEDEGEDEEEDIEEDIEGEEDDEDGGDHEDDEDGDEHEDEEDEDDDECEDQDEDGIETENGETESVESESDACNPTSLIDLFDTVTEPKKPQAETCTSFSAGIFDKCLFKHPSNSPLSPTLESILKFDCLTQPHKQLKGVTEFLTSDAATLSSFVGSYKDLVLAPEMAVHSELVRKTIALHVVTHMLDARDRVLSNSNKLRADPDLDVRDQGFTRPRILILTATKSLAREFVDCMLDFLGPVLSNVRGRERFNSQFAKAEETISDSRAEFFRGDTEDNFTLGVSVTKKSLKLGVTPLESDLLICSPLSLKMNENLDFLSSLEILVIDRADYLRMQNWEHVIDVLRKANKQPADLHGVDISRLRLSTVEGLNRNLRQTILTTDTMHADTFCVFADRWEKNSAVGNFRGFARLSRKQGSEVSRVREELQVHRQVFMAGDSLLTTFREKFWKDVGQELSRLAIVCSNYFDYLELKKFFKDETEASVSAISEFTEQKRLTGSREMFASGDKSVLILTERLLWYKPLKLKGIQHVVFYGCPSYPKHYFNMLSRMVEPSRANSVVIFTPADALALEALLGSDSIARVLPPQLPDGGFGAKMTVFT